MIAAIKSEFRKFTSIRSTYVFLLVIVALLGLFAFYISGMRAGASVNDSGKLAGDVVGAVQTIGILVCIMGALIMTHEYRYNTITYTLTASPSRMRVLLAKIVVVSVFSVVLALLAGFLSPLFSYAGLSLKGLDLVPQNLPYFDLAWRTAFTGWAYGMAGLLFAALIRNQVGTIVAILFVPSTIEGLLSMLLKENSIYLPFSSLAGVMQHFPKLEHGEAALLFSGYLLVGWAVATFLFRKRDAI